MDFHLEVKLSRIRIVYKLRFELDDNFDSIVAFLLSIVCIDLKNLRYLSEHIWV